METALLGNGVNCTQATRLLDCWRKVKEGEREGMETRIIGTTLRDFSDRRILGDIWYACPFAPSNSLPRLNPYYSETVLYGASRFNAV